MSDSQKFLSRNRAPRVQIEYDVELYGAQKKVQLPFVMGVMSDLSGKSEVPIGAVSDRKFLEIDIDNFDSRMKALKPRAAFSVPNTLTGDGQLSVDLTFEKMSDFSPAAIASKVEPLQKLLAARTQLANLMTYMDGKTGAEELLENLMADPAKFRALALGGASGDDTKAAFDAMKAAPVAEAPDSSSEDNILAGMAAEPLPEAGTDSAQDDALDALRSVEVIEETTPDAGADILAEMAKTTDTGGEPEAVDPLDEIVFDQVEEAPQTDTTADVLADLAKAPVLEETPDETASDDILTQVAEVEIADEEPVSDPLANIQFEATEEPPVDTGVDDLLNTLAKEPVAPETDEVDPLAAIDFDAVEDNSPKDTHVEDILNEVAETPLEAQEIVIDPLADIEFEAVEEAPAATDLDEILTQAADVVVEETVEADPLADIEFEVAEDAQEDTNLDDILSEVADIAEVTPTSGDPELEDILAAATIEPEPETPDDIDLEALLTDVSETETAEESNMDPLEGIAFDPPEAEAENTDLEALLAVIADDTHEEEAEADPLENLVFEADDTPEQGDNLDDLLAEVAIDQPDVQDDDPLADIAALLADVDATPIAEQEDDDLAALLADVEDDTSEDDFDLDALLADASEITPDDAAADLDALLADIEIPTAADDLDALLVDTENDKPSDDPDLDALLGDIEMPDVEGDLAALMADAETPSTEDTSVEEPAIAAVTPPAKAAFKPDFGVLKAPKLVHEPGARRKFRIALLGDFSGRGNRGDLEIGAELGKRKAFKLDFDTMEQVVMRFRTKLTLPLGDDGTAIEVELNELDDLHPDELFENVELFNELTMLRNDLVRGRNLDAAVAKMEGWGAEFGTFRLKNTKRAKGSAAPADMRLTDFQNLIGDATPKPKASEPSDLISRIVGPHIKIAADHGTEEMIKVVDRALSAAMGSVLHHPDFQTIEAAWRSIEMLGRRVETSADLEVVVYDLSVEELVADLAAQENMADCGLFDMLVEKPRQDESAGPISVVIGLYTWEETPTHAEVLARMARISTHMDAPFISSISTAYLATKPEDRHPLVKKTWDALAAFPQAKYLGLVTPRFLMRMPYGKKTEPIDRFEYEEFSTSDGMRSLLLGNSAVVVALLLAETKKQQGGNMSLGTILSLDDMPFHYMTDQYGDQVALPCTERLLNVRTSADTIARGFMPLLSVQGQNIVKLGSFQSVGGTEILGIWSGDAARELGRGTPGEDVNIGFGSEPEEKLDVAPVAKPKPAPVVVSNDDDDQEDLLGGLEDSSGDDDDLDALLSGLDDIGGDDESDDLDALLSGLDDSGADDDLDALLSGLDDSGGDDDLDDLDALLAGFGDDDDDDDDGMDLDLEALLGDL